MSKPYIEVGGPYPEMSPEQAIISIRDWEGAVLVELTLDDLQTLKEMVRNGKRPNK